MSTDCIYKSYGKKAVILQAVWIHVCTGILALIWSNYAQSESPVTVSYSIVAVCEFVTPPNKIDITASVHDKEFWVPVSFQGRCAGVSSSQKLQVSFGYDGGSEMSIGDGWYARVVETDGQTASVININGRLGDELVDVNQFVYVYWSGSADYSKSGHWSWTIPVNLSVNGS